MITSALFILVLLQLNGQHNSTRWFIAWFDYQPTAGWDVPHRLLLPQLSTQYRVCIHICWCVMADFTYDQSYLFYLTGSLLTLSRLQLRGQHHLISTTDGQADNSPPTPTTPALNTARSFDPYLLMWWRAWGRRDHKDFGEWNHFWFFLVFFCCVFPIEWRWARALIVLLRFVLKISSF